MILFEIVFFDLLGFYDVIVMGVFFDLLNNFLL